MLAAAVVIITPTCSYRLLLTTGMFVPIAIDNPSMLNFLIASAVAVAD